MGQSERQQAIRDVLERLDGIEALKQLFWHELNYERINRSLSRRDWSPAATNALAEDPLLFAGGGEGNDFHIIYARLASDRLRLGWERPVVARLLREHPYSLFVFSNDKQDQWHFVNVRIAERADEAAQRDAVKRPLFRRITVGPDERLRTACERLEMLDVAEVSRDLYGLSPLAIQQRHDEAFNVEKVTKDFFDTYCKVAFKPLCKYLEAASEDETWSHDYALQFLNRVMFLYFVQRKRWLGDDTEFLALLWKTYNGSGRAANTFVSEWLNVLFFEAFNKQFEPSKHKYLGDRICSALATAPFLNGGLFKPNELDKARKIPIPDDRFKPIFGFLESYNFTIAEDTPLDQEVAVDPEMIGKVYESLVNVSDDIDKRGDAGIF